MLNHIRSFEYERYPRQEHWQSLDKLSDLLMEPQEFVSHWRVSHSELAKIVGCSESTVAHWFCRNSTNRALPNNYHKLRLAMVHKLWSKI